MSFEKRSAWQIGRGAGIRVAPNSPTKNPPRSLRWLAAGAFALLLATSPALFAQKAGSQSAPAKTAKNPKPTTHRDAAHSTLNATKMVPEISLSRLPLGFEPNRGQVDPRVKFLARGRDYSLLLMPDGAVLRLRDTGTGDANSNGGAKHAASETTALRLEFAGANPTFGISGVDELPGKVNYFIGNDPNNWKTNLPTFSGVQYDAVYPGIDVVYHGNQQQLEYDLIVSPGADPRAIRLRIDGTDAVKIDTNGDLILRTAAGELRFRKPTVYQNPARATYANDGGGRQKIDGRFVMLAKNEIGFSVGAYDRTRKLVIDPILVYSTFAGGSQHDEARGIAVDASGNAYITGWTSLSDFPIVAGAAYSTFLGGGTDNSDIFITKLNAAGTALVYSTYVGGSRDDIGDAIAIDSNGNAYVTGETTSANFPTVAPYQANCSSTCSSNDAADAFVLELNAAGPLCFTPRILAAMESIADLPSLWIRPPMSMFTGRPSPTGKRKISRPRRVRTRRLMAAETAMRLWRNYSVHGRRGIVDLLDVSRRQRRRRLQRDRRVRPQGRDRDRRIGRCVRRRLHDWQLSDNGGRVPDYISRRRRDDRFRRVRDRDQSNGHGFGLFDVSRRIGR